MRQIRRRPGDRAVGDIGLAVHRHVDAAHHDARAGAQLGGADARRGVDAANDGDRAHSTRQEADEAFPGIHGSHQ